MSTERISEVPLMKWQKNRLYELIEKVGIQPLNLSVGFAKQTSSWELTFDYLPGANSAVHDRFTFMIRGWTSGQLDAKFYPDTSGYLRRDETGVQWTGVVTSFEQWLKTVKADCEDPDLWSIALRAGSLMTAPVFENNFLMFTEDEKLRTRAAVREIEVFANRVAQLNPAQVESLSKKMDYAIEALERNPRKEDWLYIFRSVLMTIVVEHALGSELARQLLHYASEMLQFLYAHGTKALP